MDIYGSILLTFIISSSGDAKQCYNCQDLPHPRDCLKVTTCSPGDECYTEEVVTSSGNIVYHSGCIPQTRCPAAAPVVGKRTGDITLCIDCCQGDFCNNQGCGTSEIPRDQRGPYCFNCDATWDGQKCEKAATCAKNEVCAAIQHGYVSTKCVPTCCDTDYCNTQCNNSSPHLTQAPATQTTTTPPPTTTQIQCPSDHDYDQVSGLCIKIMRVTYPVSWNKAQDACLAMGESLVSIDSQQKTVFINSLLQGTQDRWFWIGGRDQYDNSTFYWSNGKKVNYANWGGGDNIAHNKQPDDSPHHKQDCVGIHNTDYHKWHDQHCYTMEHAFICEYSPGTTPLIFPFTCEESDGYKDLGGGLCVHIHRDKALDWNHARAQCHKEETELVVLDTSSKFNTLNAYLDVHDKTRIFWIGGHDQFSNNKFYWVTGEPFTVTNWYIDPHGTHTQPDNLRNDGLAEDCVVAYPYHSHHHRWHDDKCSMHRMFICQRS